MPDVLRKTEPDYRLGWNNPLPSQVSPEAKQPKSNTTTNAPAFSGRETSELNLESSNAQSEHHVEPPTQSTPEVPIVSQTTTSNGSCASDWKKCKDNSDLVNNYSDYSEVQADCERAGNDAAKFGSPKWPGLFSGGIPFANFRGGTDYIETGIVVAIEPNAQFQNQFGAMAHSTVICKYDLQSKKVIDLIVTEN